MIQEKEQNYILSYKEVFNIFLDQVKVLQVYAANKIFGGYVLEILMVSQILRSRPILRQSTGVNVFFVTKKLKRPLKGADVRLNPLKLS